MNKNLSDEIEKNENRIRELEEKYPDERTPAQIILELQEENLDLTIEHDKNEIQIKKLQDRNYFLRKLWEDNHEEIKKLMPKI